MFKAFDKLPLHTKTWLILVVGFIGVLLQIIPAWNEPRQGVQILYLAIAVGFVAMMGMLLSSVRRTEKMEDEIKEKQLFVKNGKETFGRLLKETSDLSDELETLLVAQNDEQSRKILAALKEPFAENKRVLKKLESI